jgi:hypothetical protein
MAERNIRFNVNPDNIQVEDQGDGDGHDNQDQDNHDGQNPPNPPIIPNVQNNNQALQINIPAVAPGAAQTTLAFKVEQSKIPEFYGQKGKDNITAIVFIRRIDDLARTNRWNNTTTYANVSNTLKGFAWDWLFATVEMLDWTDNQITWTNLKPRFKKQFATQTDEKLIIEGLSNLAMRPSESTGELLAWITNTMVIIKDAYANYENKVDARAHHDINGGYSLATATRWRDMNNPIQFLKMQLYRAALTADLRKTVAQRNPNTMTLDDMYQVTTDTQREAGSNKKTIMSVQPHEGHSSDDNEEIAAFQKKKFSKNTDRKKTSNTAKGNYRGLSSSYKSGPGSNANRNGSTASTVNSRIIHKKNVSKEFVRRNLTKTNKVVLIGQKCM